MTQRTVIGGRTGTLTAGPIGRMNGRMNGGMNGRMIRLMGTLAIVAGLALAGPSAAFAQGAASAKAEEVVKAADAKRFEATTKNDLDTLASLLADDLTYTHSSASTDGKMQYLDSLRTGKSRYHTIEASDVRVRVYGTTAIVTGTAKVSVTSNGNLLNMSLRYTDVWVQRNNQWQMVAWQSTRLP